jgi:DNA-binding CsgD family transcriptional regulator
MQHPAAKPEKPQPLKNPVSYTLTPREQKVARLGELGLLLSQLAAQHHQLSAERDQIIAALAQPEPKPETPAQDPPGGNG